MIGTYLIISIIFFYLNNNPFISNQIYGVYFKFEAYMVYYFLEIPLRGMENNKIQRGVERHA